MQIIKTSRPHAHPQGPAAKATSAATSATSQPTAARADLLQLRVKYDEASKGHRLTIYQLLIAVYQMVRSAHDDEAYSISVQAECLPLMGGHFDEHQTSLAIILFMMNANTKEDRKLASKRAQAVDELVRGNLSPPGSLERLRKESHSQPNAYRYGHT